MVQRISARLTLHDLIGTGGMATVHLGRLIGPVGFARTVVIKRLRDSSDATFRAMLLDEARIAARIHHPNVVPILDVVQDGEEVYLVLDYVHGVSLASLMSSAYGPVAPPLASALLTGVLLGLQAAHDTRDESGELLDVVHRDVSPQNILVGADGLARLIDFGIARARTRQQQTAHGHVKGKLSYVAPEQLRGHPATRLSDVYAAGVVLWELLAGRRLFTGDSEAWIMEQIRTGFVEPPSKYAPGVPGELDDVVLQALSTEPRARHISAREMAASLQQAVAPALASDVGEWVSSLCGEVLKQRQDRIAAIGASVPDEVVRAGSALELKSAQVIDGKAASTTFSRTRRLSVELLGGERQRVWAWPLGAALAGLIAGGVLLLDRAPPQPVLVAQPAPRAPSRASVSVSSASAAAATQPARARAEPDAAVASAGTAPKLVRPRRALARRAAAQPESAVPRSERSRAGAAASHVPALPSAGLVQETPF